MFLKDKKSNHNNINSYVINQAKYYSNKLIANGYYNNYEREDLFQEFIIFYLKYKDNYDINKSSFKHYINVIYNNLYNDLIDKTKYKRRILYLLDNEDNNNNLTDYKDSLTEVSPFFMSLNMIDLKNTIDKLPNHNHLKDISYFIVEGYMVAEIAKKLKISKTSIYKKLKQIEKYFLDIG